MSATLPKLQSSEFGIYCLAVLQFLWGDNARSAVPRRVIGFCMLAKRDCKQCLLTFDSQVRQHATQELCRPGIAKAKAILGLMMWLGRWISLHPATPGAHEPHNNISVGVGNAEPELVTRNHQAYPSFAVEKASNICPLFWSHSGLSHRAVARSRAMTSDCRHRWRQGKYLSTAWADLVDIRSATSGKATILRAINLVGVLAGHAKDCAAVLARAINRFPVARCVEACCRAVFFGQGRIAPKLFTTVRACASQHHSSLLSSWHDWGTSKPAAPSRARTAYAERSSSLASAAKAWT